MDNRIDFTQEELQLLYAACMSYGDKLSEIVKSIPNELFAINEVNLGVVFHYEQMKLKQKEHIQCTVEMV